MSQLRTQLQQQTEVVRQYVLRRLGVTIRCQPAVRTVVLPGRADVVQVATHRAGLR